MNFRRNLDLSVPDIEGVEGTDKVLRWRIGSRYEYVKNVKEKNGRQDIKIKGMNERSSK